MRRRTQPYKDSTWRHFILQQYNYAHEITSFSILTEAKLLCRKNLFVPWKPCVRFYFVASHYLRDDRASSRDDGPPIENFMRHKTRCNTSWESFNFTSAFKPNGNVTAFPDEWLTIVNCIIKYFTVIFGNNVSRAQTVIPSDDITVCRRLSSNTNYVDHMLHNWFADRLTCHFAKEALSIQYWNLKK